MHIHRTVDTTMILRATSSISHLLLLLLLLTIAITILLQSMICRTATTSDASLCSAHDRDALLDFKTHAVLEDPAGWFSTWVVHPLHANYSTNQTSDDCCGWRGVSCDPLEGTLTGIDILGNCTDDGRPEKTGAVQAQMSAEALRALAAVSSLLSFSFSSHALNGSIPVEIGDLTSLTNLDLSCNDLSGAVPSSLANLTLLSYLNLSHNPNLHSLPQPAQDWLPSFQLQTLDLSSCAFDGPIPSWISNQSNLQNLSLAENYFSGGIPSSVLQFPLLGSLDLSLNNLTSSIPNVFVTPQLVSEFDEGVSDGLYELDLSFNGLEGLIPPSMLNLMSLTYLDLSNNQFSPQSIPSFLLELPEMQYLYLSSNRFTGPIPDVFSNSSGIEEMDLSFNQLQDVLPPSIKHLKSLSILHLNDNHFSPQEIPAHLFLLPSLTHLDLSSNVFTGISKFEFSGSKRNASPYEDYHPSDRQCFNLSSNKLTNISHITSFPSLSFLGALDLSHNQMQGELPESLSEVVPNLLILNLNDNKLRGHVPSSIQRLEKIRQLNLGSNEMNGSIPDWVGSNVSELQILDLSGNRLSGAIPASLGSLQGMQRNNQSQSEDLQVETTDNATVMVRPMYPTFHSDVTMKGQTRGFVFNNLLLLSLLDLSGNQLSGAIPPELGKLKALESLNLSGNHLDGEIPSTLGEMTKLESLDLSRNMLQGQIPASFEQLRSLAVVNLSSNHLEGSIPSGGQWDTFDKSSFEDNDGLCSQDASAGLLVCGSEVAGHASITTESPPAPEKDGSFFEGTVEWGGLVVGFTLGLMLGVLSYNILWFSNNIM